MPRFNYLDVMSRSEFHLPTSKDITDFFIRKPDMEEVPYTFIENPAECCCYIRCHLSDLKEEICQYFHLSNTNNKYRSKFRYVITLQGFRLRCPPGFSLPTSVEQSSTRSTARADEDPTTPTTPTATTTPRPKVYVKLKPVSYDNEHVLQIQSITTSRHKQVSRTDLNAVFSLQKALTETNGDKDTDENKNNNNNALVTPCCGIMAIWGVETDIDVDGLVTMTTKINNGTIDVPSHPSLVTEWSNDDLHPNTTLYVFLKKIKAETHEIIQIWNLQYFAPGKCKRHEECNCSLCKQYLTEQKKTTFNKGLLTPETPKRDVYFIRSGLSLSCKSEHVIYLVTCKKCGMQYVGKSNSKMKRKFEEHVKLFKSPEHYEKLIERKLFYSHFIEHSRENPLENITVVIIDQLASTKHSASLSINKLRQYWVRKLDTYHNGLNGEIDSTQFNQTTERSSFSQMNQTQCTIISQLDSGSFTTHAQLHRKPASSSTQQIVELHNKQTEQHDDNNNQLIVKRFLEGLET